MLIRLFQPAPRLVKLMLVKPEKSLCLRRGHPDGMQRFTINAGGCA